MLKYQKGHLSKPDDNFERHVSSVDRHQEESLEEEERPNDDIDSQKSVVKWVEPVVVDVSHDRQ